MHETVEIGDTAQLHPIKDAVSNVFSKNPTVQNNNY